MTTWVGRYAMVGGDVHEHGPWLVDRRREREDETLRLLVLTEPVDERSADFCHEVAEAVAALFAREELSITGGLLRALQQTHANLAEWNRRSLREHRVAVGVTCVVVREAEVTIAQAGPGFAYVHDPNTITRLATEGLESAIPLGADQPIVPRFTASHLAGREVLLLSEAAEAHLGRDEVERALALGAERVLAELFRQTRDVRDMNAVLIADLAVDEEQDAAPLDDWSAADAAGADPADDEPDPVIAPAAGDLLPRAPWAAPAPPASPPAPPPPPDETAGATTRQSTGTTGPGTSPSTAGPSTAGHEAAPPMPGAPRDHRPPADPPPAGPPPPPARAAEPEPDPPPGRRRGPTRNVGRAGGGPRRPRTGMADGMAAWREELTNRRLAIIAAAAIGLVALVLAGWALLPGLFNEDREEQLENAIGAARTEIERAEEANGPDQQRAALYAALDEVDRARSLAPEDPRIADLASTAEGHLSVLDAIVPVEALESLIAFDGAITDPVAPQSLALGGGALWMLEGDRGRVIRVDADGAAIEVYHSGETYGARTAGAPVDLAWDGSTARLLVLDEQRQLFAVSAAEGAPPPEPLPLRAADEIRSVAAITVYAGNLYLLDPEGGEVWRYLPADHGFDSERTGLLGNVALEQPLLLAVDGDIFVQDGGTLRRFRQGRELDPLLQGVDQPPEAPVGLAHDVPREHLYLADPAHQRVVVSEREGAFLQQYRHEQFGGLRDLAVASDGARVYVLTDDGIASFATEAAVSVTPESASRPGAPGGYAATR